MVYAHDTSESKMVSAAPSEFNIDAESFSSQYRNRLPVVLKGSVAHWPAVRLPWGDRETIAHTLGGAEKEIRVQTSKDGMHFPAVYRRGPDTEASTIGAALGSTIFSGGETSGCHHRRIYCKLSVPAALSAVTGGLPAAFGPQPTAGANTAGETTFWMGSGGVITPLHFDHCHTVIAQIHGWKRVLMVSPEDSAHVYPFSVADGATRVSRIALDAWNACDPDQRRRFPEVAKATQYEVILEPGDVIYIPPAWWHHVEALEGNVSLLLPFNMSRTEQQALPRPWTLPTWGVYNSEEVADDS